MANSTTKACIILSAAVAISAVIAQHGDAYPAADESFNGHHRVRHGGQHAYWRCTNYPAKTWGKERWQTKCIPSLMNP